MAARQVLLLYVVLAGFTSARIGDKYDDGTSCTMKNECKSGNCDMSTKLCAPLKDGTATGSGSGGGSINPTTSPTLNFAGNGSTDARVDDGSRCTVNTQCKSGNCDMSTKLCAPLKDGTATGSGSGGGSINPTTSPTLNFAGSGSTDARVDDGSRCTVNTQCKSGNCDMSTKLCAPLKDGTATGSGSGGGSINPTTSPTLNFAGSGSTDARVDDGSRCTVNTQCKSGNCDMPTKLCAPLKDGTATGSGSGGGSINPTTSPTLNFAGNGSTDARVDDGSRCTVNTQCKSGNCDMSTKLCAPLKDGTATGSGSGGGSINPTTSPTLNFAGSGSTDARVDDGSRCTVNTQCKSGNCDMSTKLCAPLKDGTATGSGTDSSTCESMKTQKVFISDAVTGTPAWVMCWDISADSAFSTNDNICTSQCRDLIASVQSCNANQADSSFKAQFDTFVIAVERTCACDRPSRCKSNVCRSANLFVRVAVEDAGKSCRHHWECKSYHCAMTSRYGGTCADSDSQSGASGSQDRLYPYSADTLYEYMLYPSPRAHDSSADGYAVSATRYPQNRRRRRLVQAATATAAAATATGSGTATSTTTTSAASLESHSPSHLCMSYNIPNNCDTPVLTSYEMLSGGIKCDENVTPGFQRVSINSSPAECQYAGALLSGDPLKAFAADQPATGYADAGSDRPNGCTFHGGNTGKDLQYFPTATGACGVEGFHCVCRKSGPCDKMLESCPIYNSMIAKESSYQRTPADMESLCSEPQSNPSCSRDLARCPMALDGYIQACPAVFANLTTPTTYAPPSAVETACVIRSKSQGLPSAEGYWRPLPSEQGSVPAMFTATYGAATWPGAESKIEFCAGVEVRPDPNTFRCVPEKQTMTKGASCVMGYECESGSCVGGVCADAPACIATNNCTDGASCTFGSECKSKLCLHSSARNAITDGGKCYATNLAIKAYCHDNRQCEKGYCEKGMGSFGLCRFPEAEIAKVPVELEITGFAASQLDSDEEREKFAQSLKATLQAQSSTTDAAEVADVIIRSIDQKTGVNGLWCCVYAATGCPSSAAGCSSGRRRLSESQSSVRIATEVVVLPPSTSTGTGAAAPAPTPASTASLGSAGSAIAAAVNSDAFSSSLVSEVAMTMSVALPESSLYVEPARVDKVAGTVPTPAPTVASYRNPLPIINGVVSEQQIYRESNGDGEGAIVLRTCMDASISDDSSTQLKQMTIKSVGATSAGDELYFTTGADSYFISVAAPKWNASTGRLVVSQKLRVVDYATLLQHLAYRNTDSYPDTSFVRAFDVQVEDTDGNKSPDRSARFRVQLSRNNEKATIVRSSAAALQTKVSEKVAFGANLTVSDTDITGSVGQPTMGTVVIKISGGYVKGEDKLELTSEALQLATGKGRRPKWDGSNATYTLDAGAAGSTLDDVQEFIRNTQFVTRPVDAKFPNLGNRTISVTVTDGWQFLAPNTAARNDESDAYSISVQVTENRHAPTFSKTRPSGEAKYLENGSPVYLQPNIVVADVDSTYVTTMTVTIVGGQTGDVLEIDTAKFSASDLTSNGLTDSWDGSTFALSVSGGAQFTTAVCQSLLRAVRYRNTAASSPLGDVARTMRIAATDDMLQTGTLDLSMRVVQKVRISGVTSVPAHVSGKITVAPSALLSMSVAATGTAPLSYEWQRYKDSAKATLDEWPIGALATNASFAISKAMFGLVVDQPGDEGYYVCKVKNEAGVEVSQLFQVHVTEGAITWETIFSNRQVIKPSVVVQEKTLIMIKWQPPAVNNRNLSVINYDLEYRYKDPPPTPGPSPTVSAWNTTEKVTKGKTEVQLVYAKTIGMDTAPASRSYSFRVRARTNDGNASAAYTTELAGIIGSPEAPTFQTNLVAGDVAVKPLSNHTLQVVTTSTTNPKATFEWTRNGEPIGKDKDSLSISFASRGRSEGVYRVRAYNYLGEVYSETVNLIVEQPPLETNLPSIPEIDYPKAVLEDAVLSCTSGGTLDSLEFKWFFCGGDETMCGPAAEDNTSVFVPVNMSDTSKYAQAMVVDGSKAISTLTVKQIEYAETGFYKCRPTNAACQALEALGSSVLGLPTKATQPYQSLISLVAGAASAAYQCNSPAAAKVGVANCQAGEKQNPNGFCVKCTPGQVQASSDHKIQSCVQCPQGQYQNQEEQITCKSCPKGRYSNAMESKICKSCPHGQYLNTVQGIVCIDCEAGRFSHEERDANNNLIDHERCKQCDSGQYQSKKGQERCNSCEQGKYSVDAQAECSVCIDGQYSGTEGSSSCESCPIGYYSNANVFANMAACKECVAGQFQYRASQANCLDCPKGYFSQANMTKTGLNDKCKSCPQGKYSNLDGGQGCKQCQIGRSGNRTGQSDCTACTLGQFQNYPSKATCINCPAGKYSGAAQTDTENSECKICKKGKYSSSEGSQSCDICPAGYYQDDELSGATECRGCAADKYNDDPEAKKESDCTACPEKTGTLAGANGTHAKPSTDDCVCQDKHFNATTSGTNISLFAGAKRGDICRPW